MAMATTQRRIQVQPLQRLTRWQGSHKYNSKSPKKSTKKFLYYIKKSQICGGAA